MCFVVFYNVAHIVPFKKNFDFGFKNHWDFCHSYTQIKCWSNVMRSSKFNFSCGNIDVFISLLGYLLFNIHPKLVNLTTFNKYVSVVLFTVAIYFTSIIIFYTISVKCRPLCISLH